MSYPKSIVRPRPLADRAEMAHLQAATGYFGYLRYVFGKVSMRRERNPIS